ncbi:hypothetical protein KSS87_023825 [Heliosperma pusillum]|nr:hypothetical protein KSS87_023825 [Heliosperma pusillum]
MMVVCESWQGEGRSPVDCWCRRCPKVVADEIDELRVVMVGDRADVSDGQWRNFRANLPILTAVFGGFTLVATAFRKIYHLRANGMSIVWLFISFIYLIYLHGVWQQWAYLDGFRGTFRWHICFNFGLDGQRLSKSVFHSKSILESFISLHRALLSFLICFLSVTLRMISFGYDYHWSQQVSHFDQEERSLKGDSFSYCIYLGYLMYAPLYIAGPIISFNAFVSQVLNFMWLKFLLIWRYFRFCALVNGVEAPENMPKCINNCHNLQSFWKSWHASYNKWLVRYIYIPLGGARTKLLNVWVIFTFVAVWHDLEWKLLSWAWLTCIFFIPEILMKSVTDAIQGDCEAKPHSSAADMQERLNSEEELGGTPKTCNYAICIFYLFILPPSIESFYLRLLSKCLFLKMVKSTVGKFFLRELGAISGAVTITCLMIANLAGFVVGPSGINFLISAFLHKEGLPTLVGIFFTFYLGTKLMFHIREAKQ